MRLLKFAAATVLAALMLCAAPLAVAGSPKGVCQAGGVKSVRLAESMTKYWTWYYGGQVGPQEIGNLFLVPMPTNGVQISDDPLIFQGDTSI